MRSTRTGLSSYEASFEGSEARKLIEAMKAASFCSVNFVATLGGPVSAKVSMIGVTDAIEFARLWLASAR